MKNALTILLAFVLAGALSAQVSNVYTTAGISQTIGAPTYRPGAKGSIVAIDTVTGTWYISRDRYSVNWLSMGDRIERVSGCSVPAYTPNKYNSELVINACATPQMYYHTGGGTWVCLNCASIGGTVTTDATLGGDGSAGDPLTIAQQSALDGQELQWTGATWEPSWGNPATFVISNSTLTTSVNTVLIGTLSGNITIGLPTCNAANNEATFEIKKNGSDLFGATIDPSGSETFADGAATKTIYNRLNINCTCRFSAGVGVWFFTTL